MKKYLIHPATFKLDGGAMFGIIPKPLWSRRIQPDELNRINMALRLIYIETNNKKILIDTGIGDYHSEKFIEQFDIRSANSPLANILENDFKTRATDLTDIILSHCHFDHIGGLGQGENAKDLVFPNASIHLNKKHYEYALNPTVRDAGSFQDHFFQPLIKQYQDKGQINFLTEDSGEIIRDGNDVITYKTSFGHTPYMIHPIFDNYIYMADLVPMSHHVRIPWVMGYDIEPGTTTKYKEIFYNHIIEKKLNMIFEHDIDTWGGTLGINARKQYELIENFQSNQKTSQELP